MVLVVRQPLGFAGAARGVDAVRKNQASKQQPGRRMCLRASAVLWAILFDTRFKLGLACVVLSPPRRCDGEGGWDY